MNGETCLRKKIQVDGLNYYLIVGDDFVSATIPYENRPDHNEQRKLVDMICMEISTLMEARNTAKDVLNRTDEVENED